MEDIMYVSYKFKNPKECDDLVCALTDFFDEYLLDTKKEYSWYKTYLYNDLFGEDYLQIAFRVPRSYKRFNNSR